MAKKIMPGDRFQGNVGEVKVIVCGAVRMRNKWVDSVTFVLNKNTNESSADVRTLPLEEFRKEFIPTTLSKGDEVVCVCMGKIRGVYEIVDTFNEDNEDKVKGWNNNRSVFFNPNIAPNGHVVCLDDTTNGVNMYIFVTDKLERQLAFNKILSKCLTRIGNIQKALSLENIDIDAVQIDDLNCILGILDETKNVVFNRLKHKEDE